MKSFAVKQLTYGKNTKGGRNNYGRITVPRRKNLTKRVYRFLDTKRIIPGPAQILSHYLYDPFRSGYISLIILPNGVLTYILAAKIPNTQTLIYNLQKPLKRHDKGWSSFLYKLPLGTVLFNLEIIPSLGGKIARAAGNSAMLISLSRQKKNLALVKLKSGEYRYMHPHIVGVVGVSSHFTHFLRDLRKAGIKRYLGYRPRSRPSARNPVDHPMGGRTRGGTPQSPRGILANQSTRRNKQSNLILIKARITRLKKKKRI